MSIRKLPWGLTPETCPSAQKIKIKQTQLTEIRTHQSHWRRPRYISNSMLDAQTQWRSKDWSYASEASSKHSRTRFPALTKLNLIKEHIFTKKLVAWQRHASRWMWMPCLFLIIPNDAGIKCHNIDWQNWLALARGSTSSYGNSKSGHAHALTLLASSKFPHETTMMLTLGKLAAGIY